MAQPPLSGLSEAERARAFERFNLLRPFLEEGVPLARVARDRGLALRTARRWAAQYRRQGLAGLARKGRSDRGKRHLSATLRQAIEGLALKKPPLPTAEPIGHTGRSAMSTAMAISITPKSDENAVVLMTL
jgi:putative transposase